MAAADGHKAVVVTADSRTAFVVTGDVLDDHAVDSGADVGHAVDVGIVVGGTAVDCRRLAGQLAPAAASKPPGAVPPFYLCMYLCKDISNQRQTMGRFRLGLLL